MSHVDPHPVVDPDPEANDERHSPTAPGKQQLAAVVPHVAHALAVRLQLLSVTRTQKPTLNKKPSNSYTGATYVDPQQNVDQDPEASEEDRSADQSFDQQPPAAVVPHFAHANAVRHPLLSV
jgi:hypothetical protein